MDLIVSVNKQKDISSHDAVRKVKKILQAKKAGHTGTLDPMATGLLIICTNRATRLADYFSSLHKEYRAIMKLGETTDTQDADGRVIAKEDASNIDGDRIKSAVDAFKGSMLQLPPMFSALKHKGKPLYKLARKGIEIERKSREVNIYQIELLDINIPYVEFKAICSKGTYIRTLCDDIGKKLGVGAHLFELERTAVGQFCLNDSVTIEELKSVDMEQLNCKGIYTKDKALSWMPELKIEMSMVKSIKNGVPIEVGRLSGISDEIKSARGIRIKSPDDELLAVASYRADKDTIKMDVVFA
jgi:tRNA pseudouridine55 synthase